MVHIDRDLWEQRRGERRDRHDGNGSGSKNGWKTLPWSAIVTLLLGLVAWVVSSVLWLARLESDIQAVKLRDAELHTKVNTIGGQLDEMIRRMGILDERQAASVLRNNSQDERMERMESQGTRRLPILEERQTVILRRLDAITNFLSSNSNFRLQADEPPRR